MTSKGILQNKMDYFQEMRREQEKIFPKLINSVERITLKISG
jgi:hypothetical protein